MLHFGAKINFIGCKMADLIFFGNQHELIAGGT